MKNSTKILIACGIITALSTSILAAGQLMTIDVDPSIKILVDGEEFHPKDANGNDVMTFSYNGTTYAPLRALAEAYGLEVGYDSDRRMATVSSSGGYSGYENNSGYQNTNNVLYDDDFITISFSRVYSEENYWGETEYYIELLGTNKTNVELSAKSWTMSLNGFSYNLENDSYSIAPDSSGYLRYKSEDNVELPMTISKISGKLEITDFSETLHFNDNTYAYYYYNAQFSGNIN